MAAAEARAAWQRMANRCFVQEDAKRAPKLACCPSSLKLQPDPGNGTTANGSEQPVSNFMPFNWNPSDCNLPPDTKWWLQLQPNFGYQNDVICEQLSASEGLEVEREETVIPTSKDFGDPTLIATSCANIEKKSSSLEAPWMVSASFPKHESEARVEELKMVNNNFQWQNKLKADLGEHWCQEDLIDWKAFDRLISKKPEKACSDLQPTWVGSEKIEPWWRIADRDELASLVAQKSSEYFENCDLPRPQRVHFCGDPFGCLEGFDDNRYFASPLDHRLHAATCYPADYANNYSSTSGNMNEVHLTSGVRHSASDSAETHSGTCTHGMHTCSKDLPESKHRSECNSDKSALLEALHHSQKRAREAEMAAQQAYIEKEHIVKLFFKQASYLFAYKQWFRMLQLESLFLQLKMKEDRISSLLPIFPWMPPRESQFGGSDHKAKKGKGQKQQKSDICRYALAFAVGLGLVSAGLLFGWTLGRLLPIV